MKKKNQMLLDSIIELTNTCKIENFLSKNIYKSNAAYISKYYPFMH